MNDSTVDQIEFDKFLAGEFGGGRPPIPYPHIRASGNGHTLALGVTLVEFMDLDSDDHLVAAPNPDDNTGQSFFITKCSEEGYSLTLNKDSNVMQTSSGLLRGVTYNVDLPQRWEVSETDLFHPEWGERLYLGTTVSEDEHERRIRRA